MNNKIKAVIFDLDGVIVSTDDLHYQAWNYMAMKHQIYFDKTINHRLRGVSRMESLEIILERSNKIFSEEEKNDLAKEKNEYYIQLLKTLSPKDILPNVDLVIKRLKDKGIKVAIGSSSKNALNILKQIKRNQSFDAVADGNDITHSKPDPEVFLVAAKKLNVEPEACMVIEDAQAGIVAAKNASMIAVAISDAKLSDLSDYKIDDLIELLQLV